MGSMLQDTEDRLASVDDKERSVKEQEQRVKADWEKLKVEQDKCIMVKELNEKLQGQLVRTREEVED